MRDQTVIDKAIDKIEDARAELEKARRRFSQIHSRQKKIILAEEAKDEMTLERALEPFIPGTNIANDAGHAWLHERTWKGEWKGTGIMTSGYFQETMQTVVKVGIPRNFERADLEKTAAILENEVIPVIRPGSHAQEAYIKDVYGAAKAIEVFDDDCGESHSYMLFIQPDGTVDVTNIRYYRDDDGGSCIYRGNLLGALTVIRNNLSYN